LADLIKYAFVAGEIAETLFSRSDLEKYDLAVALAQNWFVDYRGGVSTRGGSRFIDFIKTDDKPVKLFPFRFAPAVAQTYTILAGDLYLRFLQGGAYVLEDVVTVTSITQADPNVVTAAGHGFADGDWVQIVASGMTELNGRTFAISTVAANTFRLIDALTGDTINTTNYTAFTNGTVARVYTLTTPWIAADLELLRSHQSRSVVYFTHQDYKPRKLTRVSHSSWTLEEVVFDSGVAQPSTPTINAGVGAAGVGFQVTAVDINGRESAPSDYGFDSTAVDYSSTAGQAKVTWNTVTQAVLYRVYRTQIIPTGTDITRTMAVGFVGIAYGSEFIDANIVPDFTDTPPQHYDPFADGAIEYIDVTSGGAGYTNASEVSITTGTGSGFIGYAVVNAAGALIAIGIVNGGSGYLDSDTVSVTVGAGATFTTTLTPASGNNPGVSTVFQQRKIYAGSTNDPLTLWGSKPGEYETMDVSTIVQEDDAYEFEVDSEEVAPIRHLLATRSGLVIITQAGIWQLTGGSGVAVTPTNALADPQSYTGCSILPPLPIDTDILYQEGKGATVRLLSYSDYSKIFSGQDLSILSNHLTTPSLPIKAWTYASDPFKIVHAVRSDGIMLNLTLVKEQNIYGWATQSTQGLYKDVLTIQEDRSDVVYTVVQRLVNGRYSQFIEQLVRREFVDVEDAWFVDSGLATTPTYPAATLTASAVTGSGITFTASSGVFVSGDVGSVIRMGGGKAIITAFTDAEHVTATIMRDITSLIPETTTPLRATEGEWTLDAPTTAVSGLWHLEGMTVKVLGDGNVLNDQVVVNGAIELEKASTRITVGLGYRCILQTLPPSAQGTTLEGKRKRPVGVKARTYNSRGLRAGNRVDHTYPMKERTDEPLAEATRLQKGIKPYVIDAKFDREAQIVFLQDEPLPATILGFVLDLQAGDVSSRG
jgi:hypothetical protein